MANNYGVSRRTLLGVGGLMLGVGLVGCSDSEEGWESVTVDRITVSHPTEWVEKPPENENFTKNFTDGPHGMQIAGHYSDDTEPTLAWSVLEFMIRGTFQGYDPKGYQEITVKGAARAIKCPFDFTYKGKSARGIGLLLRVCCPQRVPRSCFSVFPAMTRIWLTKLLRRCRSRRDLAPCLRW